MSNFVFFKAVSSLGDAFVLHGMIRYKYLEDASNHVIYLCNPRYFKTIEKMYEDYDNITIIHDEHLFNGLCSVLKKNEPDPVENQYVFISTKVTPLESYWLNWDRQIYEFYDVPFKARYSHFQLPKNNEGSARLFAKLVEPGERYILRHAFMSSLNETYANFDVSYFNPENLKVIDIVPNLTDNFFDYVDLITHAEQIHVTPSSTFCFIDGIHHLTSGQKFLHLIRKDYLSQYNSFLNNFCWTPVFYPEEVKF
jgi:hypothetical protein